MAILPNFLLFIAKILLCSYQISSTTDTITQFKSLHDGSTLASKSGTFELGFFSPGSSTNRYVGIWYKNIPVRRVVWVANRDHPIIDNPSVLCISKEGNLVLLSKNQTLLWSTNSTTKALSPIVQLLDTGNLVLREENNNSNYEDSFLWQSFDYPCDTLLPGMKLGLDLKTGLNRRLTAWKNWDDPTPGNFSWGIVLTSNPELVLWKGSVEYHRSGPWNGIGFSGAPVWRGTLLAVQKLVNNSDEVYYTYTLKIKSMISITTLNQTLYLRQRITWVPENNTWRIYQYVPGDSCDTYNTCGPYGYCIVNQSPICQCLEGFKPKSSQNWDTMDWTQGCVRSEPWGCRLKDTDGFRKFPSLKLPDTTHSWVNGSMTLEDCKAKCMENCSCMAYASLNVRGDGSGCAMWFGDLRDLRLSGEGQDLYVRMAISWTDAKHKKRKKTTILAITITLPIVLVLLLIISYIYRAQKKFQENTKKTLLAENEEESGQEDLELPIFDLAIIAKATDNFSIDNKLGQGGFGPVYKGTLATGQEIAVKRLSKSSRQGLNEFKNEVILCAKLQHRNLVKVLGCCIQGDEKMLVYEYMPNKSLDLFLFDSAQGKLLDWSKRFHIMCAIARGLLYLHQDSRLRIIHRDLKASNILLDDGMNAKISDFGLARMCRSDQDEGNTNRVVGTYGYMAPEYASDGLFSTKSDVFSFGILLLEIISGKRNKGITYPSHSHNLIGHAWRLWNEGNSKELIDDCLRDSCILSKILRCIQIGLLCVQHHPNDRPNIASVVIMLNNENPLPQPKEPGFLIHEVSIEGERNQTSSSTNQVTITLLNPR